MESATCDTWISATIRKKEFLNGTHRYCIKNNKGEFEIFYGDIPLSDATFPGWRPLIAFEECSGSSGKLFQVDEAGRIVEWLLRLKDSLFIYVSHKFVDVLPSVKPPKDRVDIADAALNSLGIQNLQFARELIKHCFVVNYEALAKLSLSSARQLVIGQGNLICDLSTRQVSPAYADQLREAIGPELMGALAHRDSEPETSEYSELTNHLFRTCSERWLSKVKFLHHLIQSKSEGKAPIQNSSWKHAHLFSFSPSDHSWICHAIEISSKQTLTAQTLYLIESGEVGLFTAVFVPGMDALIISPHDKNGVIDHQLLASRIAEAMVSFCTSTAHCFEYNHKSSDCVLLTLTNAGNLYHTVANDLFGYFAISTAFSTLGSSQSVAICKAREFLPVSIPDQYFEDAPSLGMAGVPLGVPDSKTRIVNLPEGNFISGQLVTLCKAPYFLKDHSLIKYQDTMKSLSEASSNMPPLDLKGCSLGNTCSDPLDLNRKFIVFGIRCARRKPVNQFEMLMTVLESLEILAKPFTIILEGTYALSGTNSEQAFIDEEILFTKEVESVITKSSYSTSILSFVGRSQEYSSYSAFLEATIIAPWGAGLTRHMFFAQKEYLLHSNSANLASMVKDYYSWELPYKPSKLKYLSNQGGDVECFQNEEVLRLDPSRPAWRIFDDYFVDVNDLRTSIAEL